MLHGIKRTNALVPSVQLLVSHVAQGVGIVLALDLSAVLCRPRCLSACRSCLLLPLTGRVGRIEILLFVSAQVTLATGFKPSPPKQRNELPEANTPKSSHDPEINVRNFMLCPSPHPIQQDTGNPPSTPATPSTPSASAPVFAAPPSPYYAPETHLVSSSSHILGSCTRRIDSIGAAGSGTVSALLRLWRLTCPRSVPMVMMGCEPKQ